VYQGRRVDSTRLYRSGQYIEFDGRIECAECGKEGREDDPDWSFESRYAFCCHRCHGRFVGVF
jgi:hypothetical protein